MGVTTIELAAAFRYGLTDFVKKFGLRVDPESVCYAPLVKSLRACLHRRAREVRGGRAQRPLEGG
eukprot:1473250-Pyramimonas_sp.AAC.1